MPRGTDQIARLVPAGEAGASATLAAASAAQRRLWLVERGGRAGTSYLASMTVPLAGRLDRSALQAALDALAARHAPLRTVYADVGGEPRQRILPPARVALRFTEPVAGETLDQVAARERATPVDLAAGPVFRAVAVAEGEAARGLVLLVHHIAFDGWSIGILTRELGALYRASVAGARSDRLAAAAGLAPLAADFAEVAGRRAGSLDADREAADLAFWRERLAGLEPVEPDVERGEAAGGAVRLPIRITRPVLARIDKLALGLETTRFTVLLAVFLALLGRVAGSDRPAVGIPVSGRDDADAEALVGFFVDTLVIDTDLSDRPSLAALVGRLRGRVLDAFDHRSIAYERVAEAIGDDAASGSGGRLFDVAFGLQQAPAAPEFGPGLDAGPMAVDLGVRFAFETYLWPEGDGLAGVLLADSRRVSLQALEDLRRWFLVLLARSLGEPETPLCRLALTTPEERERAVRAWNDTAVPQPATSVVDLVADVTRRHGDRVAIRDGAALVTYAGLWSRSDGLAAGLARAGVEPGGVVGVLARRSAETVAVLLAILRCGAAYMVIDPGQPAGRIREIVTDAAPALVVSTIGDPPEPGRPVLTADALAALGAVGETEPAPAIPAEAIAYVNYTSGSTGRPKPIAIPHRAVVRLATGQDWLPLGPGDVVAHASNPAFDAATFEIWSTLAAGATLAILAPETVADPPRLVAALAEHGVGAAFLTTALFNQAVDHDPNAFAGLSDLLFGGEAVDPRRVARLLSGRPPRRLWHVYGPTETTTFASRHLVADAAGGVPIGRPLANTSLHVLDPEGQPVPPGAAGELWIGGPGLAQGYPGHPALTADRFRPDPFSTRPGARLYRTGDRVRLGRDGAILFVGRMDRQVKIRGFRVEPAEIEAALQSIDGVGAAAVLVDEAGERRLVAHVASAHDESTIRAALKARLPAYMVPAVILRHDALPANRVGKIDRAALARLRPAEPVAQGGVADPLVAEIAARMGEVLGREAVGPDDDFFDLGGHSLAATRLAARLRARFDVEMGLVDLFDATTPAALARLVSARAASGQGPSDEPNSARPAVADPAETLHPLSFAQSRLWFLDRMGLTGAAYHSPLAFRLAGPLDRAALEGAIGDLVRRHEPLRTVFVEVDGVPHQRVRADVTVPLDVVDCPAGDPDALQDAVDEAVSGWFDLEEDAMLRARLVVVGPDDHVLVLVFHHVAFDGWSLPIAVEELGRFYAARLAGGTADLPPLPTRYVAFAAAQRARFEAGAGRALVEQAVARLSGLPELDLPTDRPRGRFPRHRGARLDVHWEEPLAARLSAFARERKVTLSMLLLSGFTALMQRWTGHRHVLVGSPIAGRTEAAVHGLIGFFVNSLVLATDLGGDPDFDTVIARVRTTALEAYASQDLPFEKLVEALRPDRDLARHPLFQVVFVLQDEAAMAPRPAFAGLDATLLPPGRIHVRFELEVHLYRAPDGIRGYLFYDRDLFEADTIRALESQLAVLLDAGTRHPTLRLSALPLSAVEEARAIDAWSRA